MKRVVVVLGGNAFASGGPITMDGQFEFAHRAAEQLVPLLGDDTQLLVSHGNGPQVGHILRRVEAALGEAYGLPLDVCVAESEGELGFVLAQALGNTFAAHGKPRDVVSLLTQVEVSPEDPAFRRPDKPIGPFLDEQQARQLQASGIHVMDDAGRGYRRVVPSPVPRKILELRAIELLLEAGQIVVAAGGGGIPVVKTSTRRTGVEAVIDKDLTGALMAQRLEAELLVILTCVPCVYLGYNTPRQLPIRNATPNQMMAYLEKGHFAPGSMLPKVQAAIQFASTAGRRAIICDVANLPQALTGDAGTIIMTASSTSSE